MALLAGADLTLALAQHLAPAPALTLTLALSLIPFPTSSPTQASRWQHTSGLLLHGSSSLAPAQRQLLGQQPAWQLALCAGGESGSELLALWRDGDVCLYSPRDNFTTPVGIWPSGTEREPALRRLAWNGDQTMLAAASSTGRVVVLDVKARPLHTLPASSWSREHGAGAAGPAEPDTRCDLAGLCFREPLGGRGMRSELLLLSCSGVLHRFYVPSAAAAAVHGSGPSRAAAPPLHLSAHHPLVSCLAF